MPRVDNDGHVTAVVNSRYPKKLIFISRLDCVAGARTLPGKIKRVELRTVLAAWRYSPQSFAFRFADWPP